MGHVPGNQLDDHPTAKGAPELRRNFLDPPHHATNSRFSVLLRNFELKDGARREKLISLEEQPLSLRVRGVAEVLRFLEPVTDRNPPALPVAPPSFPLLDLKCQGVISSADGEDPRHR